MFSLCSKTVKIHRSGLFIIDAAVMSALEPLGIPIYMYIYACIYICAYRYTYIAFQSAVRQI